MVIHSPREMDMKYGTWLQLVCCAHLTFSSLDLGLARLGQVDRGW